MVRDELEHKLNYDHLTELLNRQTALSGIDELLSNDDHFTCVLMDIDNLKELNEYRGYEAGDLYLSSVATRLKRMEKAYGAIAARYGGDEFLLIFPGNILQENSQELQELLSIFQRSITVGGETVYMNSSGGGGFQWKRQPRADCCFCRNSYGICKEKGEESPCLLYG